MNWLKGKKTYFVAAGMAVVQVAHMLGYLDADTTGNLLKLLGAGGVATLAAKVNRATF